MFDLNRDGFVDFQDLVVLAVGIAAIITAVGLMRKRIVKPLAAWAQRQVRQAIHETIAPDLAEIRHEVTTNDGSSLKDAVKSVQTDLGTIHTRLDALGAQIDTKTSTQGDPP